MLGLSDRNEHSAPMVFVKLVLPNCTVFTMKHFIPAILASGVVLAFLGCGDFGGGASVVPEVVVLPPDHFSGEADDGSSSDTTAGPEAESAQGAGGTGTFRGRVVLTGTPSKPLPLAPLHAKGAAVKDAESCSLEAVPNEQLVVSADKGVQNVFIYMPRAPKGVKLPPLATEPLLFDQVVCRFKPHCLVVATGQPVKVLNADAKPHNTHTYPLKNDGVNSVVSGGEREGKLEITYNRSESLPLAVKCDYHTWMVAYHLPLDHPFGTVTDENGEFEIPNLPAGEHTFVVWHENVGYVERKLKVTVKAGEPDLQTIDFPADKLTL